MKTQEAIEILLSQREKTKYAGFDTKVTAALDHAIQVMRESVENKYKNICFDLAGKNIELTGIIMLLQHEISNYNKFIKDNGLQYTSFNTEGTNTEAAHRIDVNYSYAVLDNDITKGLRREMAKHQLEDK